MAQLLRETSCVNIWDGYSGNERDERFSGCASKIRRGGCALLTVCVLFLPKTMPGDESNSAASYPLAMDFTALSDYGLETASSTDFVEVSDFADHFADGLLADFVKASDFADDGYIDYATLAACSSHELDADPISPSSDLSSPLCPRPPPPLPPPALATAGPIAPGFPTTLPKTAPQNANSLAAVLPPGAASLNSVDASMKRGRARIKYRPQVEACFKVRTFFLKCIRSRDFGILIADFVCTACARDGESQIRDHCERLGVSQDDGRDPR